MLRSNQVLSVVTINDEGSSRKIIPPDREYTRQEVGGRWNVHSASLANSTGGALQAADESIFEFAVVM